MNVRQPTSLASTGSTGMFIAIVGPSGAGKDTIIAGLRQRLHSDRFHFPRRIITREPDATEDCLFYSEEAFHSARISGEFLLAWDANTLHYAIPRAAGDELEQGRHVIANVSRRLLPDLRRLLPRVLVVHVTARPDLLAERLRRRGREVTGAQQERLERGLQLDEALVADIRIENNGRAEEAILALVNVLALLPPPQRTILRS